MGKLIELINRESGRTDTEDSKPIRIFTWASVMLGVAVSGYYAEIYGAVFFGLAGVTAGYLFSYYRRRYSNWWMRVALTFALFGAGFSYVREMVYQGRDHVVILTELMIVMQVFHSFDLPRRKDLVYSVLSAFMLICVGGVLSRTMWYGLYLFAFIAIAIVMLAMYQFSEASQDAAVHGDPRKISRTIAATLALLVIGFPLFFVLMPRYETHELAGFPVSGRVQDVVQNFSGQVMYPEPPNSAHGMGAAPLDDSAIVDSSSGFGAVYFGFSPTLNLNARGRLPEELLIRVRTQTANYYRGLVFDTYTNNGWTLSDRAGKRIANKSGGSRISLEDFKVPELKSTPFSTGAIYQTFYFEKDMPNLIYAALEPVDLYFPVTEIVMDKNTSLRAGYIMRAGSVYTVMSKAPSYTKSDFKIGRDPCKGPMRDYCTIEGVSPKVVALAERITAGANGNYQKLELLRAYLMTNMKYDIDAPRAPRGVDPIEFFLFKSKRGFCEHFASAFTLMARAVGVPSRLVTGFAPGNFNFLTGFFEIHGTDAHAWSEEFFPYIGWVGFDPTPGAPDGPIDQKRMTPMGYIMEAYAERLRTAAGELLKKIPGLPPAVFGAAFAMLAAVAAAVFILSRKRSAAGVSFRELARENARVAREYARTVEACRRSGLAATSSSTPSELSEWFGDDSRDAFIELGRLYEKAVYSRDEMQSADADAAHELGARIVKSVKQHAGV